MGNKQDPEAPARNPVPEGKTRVCVAGYGSSPNYTRARNVAHEIGKSDPSTYETWFYGPSRDKYFQWLAGFKDSDNIPEEWKGHKTAPICWFEKPGEAVQIIGGRDRLCEWTVKNLPDSPAANLATSSLFAPMEYFGDEPKGTAT